MFVLFLHLARTARTRLVLHFTGPSLLTLSLIHTNCDFSNKRSSNSMLDDRDFFSVNWRVECVYHGVIDSAYNVNGNLWMYF